MVFLITSTPTSDGLLIIMYVREALFVGNLWLKWWMTSLTNIIRTEGFKEIGRGLILKVTDFGMSFVDDIEIFQTSVIGVTLWRQSKVGKSWGQCWTVILALLRQWLQCCLGTSDILQDWWLIQSIQLTYNAAWPLVATIFSMWKMQRSSMINYYSTAIACISIFDLEYI